MTKSTNSKQGNDQEQASENVLVIEDLNLEFIWNLVRVIWNFHIN